MSLPCKDDKELAGRIDEVYKNKKVIQFSDYPVVTDLLESPEIAQDIINELRKPGNTMNEVLLRENQRMTTESIINYIEWIIKNQKKSIWSNKWVITLIAALIILLLSFVIFKFTQKIGTKNVDTGNSMLNDSFINGTDGNIEDITGD